jgi:TPR repeat protein
MIKGYGNALYRLGRRYEIGDGAFANPREAFRCYAKSARLGNIWSLGRLASRLFTPEQPDPPAADAPPEPDPVLH